MSIQASGRYASSMTMTLCSKLVVCAVIVPLCFSSMASSQDKPQPPQQPASDPTQFQPVPPRDLPPIDPAMKAAGEALLRQAAETFKQAPAIVSRTQVKVSSGENNSDLIVDAMFGPDGSMRVETADSLVVVKDGWLNMILYSVYDRYIRVPASPQISDNIFTIFGDRALAGFEILMREGQPLKVWLETLMMRSIGVPLVAGVDVITTPEGKNISRIQVLGRMGAGSVDYDPETKMIVSARSTMFPISGVEGFEWSMVVTTDIKMLDKLPEPITFDPGRRLAVENRRDLDPVARNILKVGQPAPPLRLPQLDGPIVDLSQLKGEVVVLDFWASHSDACMRSLKFMDELYRQRDSMKTPFKMFAVNVAEKAFDAAEQIERVSGIWLKEKYKFPSLIASGDSVTKSWGIVSIPLLVVIDREGRVAYEQYGLLPDTKTRVEEALKKVGGR